MKAQVLHKYDPEMKEKIWVTEQEMPDPKLEKSTDVIVKIGAAGVCRTDLHIIEGVWTVSYTHLTLPTSVPV